jgi:hypothetical protein
MKKNNQIYKKKSQRSKFYGRIWPDFGDPGAHPVTVGIKLHTRGRVDRLAGTLKSLL